MTGPVPFPAEPYEELRRAALGVAPAVPNGRGLALLMRQGMAAWMQAWVSFAAAPAPARREPARHPAVHPELVVVWAEMALAAAREVAP